MTYLEHYLKRVSPGLRVALQESVQEFSKKHIAPFECSSHVSGLLYGHVQSGKTGQMLAVVADAADNDFKFFILFTTDNVILHKQTLKRAKSALGGFATGFNVLGETDEQAFLNRDFKMRPTLIVLKKNAKVLRTWANNIAANPRYKNEPLFILDDEADAASLNTKTNQQKQSTINGLLERIRERAPSSIYLHVTATPQSLLLQTSLSGWRPEFSFYLPPGEQYWGGDFFYDERSTCLVETKDNERDELVKEDKHVPTGLRKAALHFLVAASDLFTSQSKQVCTMLIHTGSLTREHRTVSRKVEEFLEGVKNDLLSGASTLEHEFRDAWTELSKTKEDISDFKAIMDFLRSDMPTVNIIVLNSKSPDDAVYDKGLNVVIGGNTLGRGVTFPGLQIVYYCRSSKKPQADTSWQHARIFGYDRDPGLCRVFSPYPLIKLFRDLNDANNALFETLQQNGPQGVSILSPRGTRPTRPSVVMKDGLLVISGNVNYFPMLPNDSSLSKLDEKLGTEKYERDISLAEAEGILRAVSIEKEDLWNSHSFPDCVNVLKNNSPQITCKLIVRTGRSIRKKTGTLLSPTDRQLGAQHRDQLVLTMYRINGEKSKGWNDRPLWVPNIKFPAGVFFSFQMG